MKNSLFTILLFFLFSSPNIAQSFNKKEKSNNITDKLWYGINIGNIGLYSNQFNTNLSLMGGYKLTKSINIGTIVHGYYTYIWQIGDHESSKIFDYGFGGLATIKVYKNYFAQLEVDQMYRTTSNLYGNRERTPYLFTYLGAGYEYTSPSKWSFIATLLYNFNPDSNHSFFPLDYRVAFIYNF